jgi:hypothetical protein
MFLALRNRVAVELEEASYLFLSKLPRQHFLDEVHEILLLDCIRGYLLSI